MMRFRKCRVRLMALFVGGTALAGDHQFLVVDSFCFGSTV
jgi:hypothetical protein